MSTLLSVKINHQIKRDLLMIARSFGLSRRASVEAAIATVSRMLRDDPDFLVDRPAWRMPKRRNTYYRQSNE